MVCGTGRCPAGIPTPTGGLLRDGQLLSQFSSRNGSKRVGGRCERLVDEIWDSPV
jgi:hypothetical protein